MSFIANHRLNNFDFIRFVAASTVCICHAIAIFGGTQPMLIPESNGELGYAGIGLMIFFFVSGFLVTGSWESDPVPVNFLKKRILRIYPGLIVNILITVFIIGLLATTRGLGAYFSYILNHGDYYISSVIFPRNFYLPGCFEQNPNMKVNGSLWTIQYEFKLYFMTLLIGVLGLINRKKYIFVFIPLFLWATVYALKNSSFIHTGAFLLGAVYYIYRDKISRHPIMALTCFLIMIAVHTNSYEHWFGGEWTILLLLIAVPYLIFHVAFSCAELRGFGKYGDFSYGIYIYGFPTTQLVYTWLGKTVGFPEFMLLSFSLVFCLAIASWHLIEKPCMRFKPRPHVNT